MSDSGRTIGQGNLFHPNYSGPRLDPAVYAALLDAADRVVKEMDRYGEDESDGCELYPYTLMDIIHDVLRPAVADAKRSK